MRLKIADVKLLPIFSSPRLSAENAIENNSKSDCERCRTTVRFSRELALPISAKLTKSVQRSSRPTRALELHGKHFHRHLAGASSIRGVAQSGSAPGSGPGGRRFESSRPDHLIPV